MPESSPFLLPDRQIAVLNERRQALSVSAMADQSVSLGSGRLILAVDSPWMCKAVACDLDAPLGRDHVARIVSFFADHGVVPCIELTAYSHEVTLAAVGAAGFRLCEVEHVLAHSLEEIPDVVVPGLSVAPVSAADAGACRRHAALVLSGFVPAGTEPPAALVAGAMRSLQVPWMRGLVARMEGEEVGASGMEVVDVLPDAPPLVALWGTTVRPAFRQRGIQQALIVHRLRLGRAAGARLAIIESRPGIPTERNAARVGFRLAYTRLVFKAD